MKDQLISFETAKLIKEKRFIVPTYYFYNNNNEVYTYSSLMDWNRLIEEDWNKNRYNAPTQSLLQRWFREVHNIHINITDQYHKNE